MWRSGDAEIGFAHLRVFGNRRRRPGRGDTATIDHKGPVGNLQRRMFSGPWQWSWDASAVKSFQITERHKLDLHFDVTNWMNHPTFYVYPSSGDYGTATPSTVNSTSFGKIQYMNLTPRVIQIGAYYRF